MLEKLYKHHSELIKMASLFSKQYAEDIVQDAYIKLHQYSTEEKCFTNDNINKSYIFFVIRSVFIDNYINKNQFESFYNCGDIDDEYLIIDEFNEEEEIEWYKFTTKCKAEVDSWDMYDKKLFTLYRESGKSMRKIAEETGISFVSIFHSLKEHKKRLRELFKEDYQNLKE